MKILFLGNGFDLYHGLKTSYLDFLKIIQNLDEFKTDIEYFCEERNNEDGEISEEHIFKDYFQNISGFNKDDLSKIYTLLYGNVWTIYYGKCNANIQGWIDFENEMNPVLNFFRNVFSKGIGINSLDKYIRNPTYQAESYKEVALANIFNMFFDDVGGSVYLIKKRYVDKSYGLLKNKIIETLERDLDKFTLAFNIYLRAFVESRNIDEYDWIKNISPDRIISFNYTKTEKYYFSYLTDVALSHVHGSTEYNNIVFGTDWIDDSDIDFMNFSKRFQRLTKVGDFSYINFATDPCDFDDLFKEDKKKNDLIVSFIGCSLDKNDSAIFKEYVEAAREINIYCYGFSDYRKAMRNLISIFGSDFMGELQRESKISFWDIKSVGTEETPEKIEPRAYYRGVMDEEMGNK